MMVDYVPIEFKRNLYKITIIPTMLYGINECWVVKKQYIHKISELKWVC